ncbi:MULTISPECIES: MJ0307 family thioredoxin [unclassified Methanobrevibacter]|jgi:small redox-active disulfide protein 1|uniref:MJ0307 family thioredoxin n=1 Tax=unclassified Methanobrevibacter TaxID=2638681 RepID=UPI0039B88C40
MIIIINFKIKLKKIIKKEKNIMTKIEVFTSPTCPHCPAAVKVVEEAKKQIEGIEIEVLDASNEENREKAMEYQIYAVPTIVIDGNVEFVGAPTLQELLTKLQN